MANCRWLFHFTMRFSTMKVSPATKTFFRVVALKRLSFLGLLVPIESLVSSKLIKILQYLKLQYLKLRSFNISKAVNISSQYLKTRQYLKPISQASNISACLTNISTCLKMYNISKRQYLNLPYQYLNLPQVSQYLKMPISQLA